jgi:hypothetical protein
MLLLASWCAIPTAAGARVKTDTVILTNGDHLTGEIVELDRGILKLSTDGMGTVSIEWDDVGSLNSTYQFRVEDTEGEMYFGAIAIEQAGGTLDVIHGADKDELPHSSVVAITPLEASLWEQLDGAISIGYSFTKSNSLSQLTLDAWIQRRTLTHQARFDASSIVSDTDDSVVQQRYDVTADFREFFGGSFFGLVGAGMQRNDELGLDLRSAGVVGIGANLVQTNRTDFVAAGGLSVNHEWANDGTDRGNLEAPIVVEHAIFGYDFPKIDYSTQLAFYPSLNDWGRVRVELDFRFSREIVSDFFIEQTFYDSYDNRPPGGGEKSDYGLVFSLGWSF